MGIGLVSLCENSTNTFHQKNLEENIFQNNNYIP